MTGSEKKQTKSCLPKQTLWSTNFNCPRIKLLFLQTSNLDGVETGKMLPDFAQQQRRKNARISDIYFNLHDAAGKFPILVLNQNAKTKKRETGSLRKTEWQTLQTLYTQEAAVYGSKRILLKVSILSVVNN